MQKQNEEFLWHKLTTRKQNWIVIEVSAFVSLLILGIMTLISKI